MTTTTIDTDQLRQRLQRFNLWGLLEHFDGIATEPWLPLVIEYEETERTRRSLERRLKNARLGSFKSIADFDWTWPRKLDRAHVDELFTLTFMEEGANVLLIGPNGIGKSMLAKNLAHQAVVRGHTVRFTTASDMLNDLAAQDTDASFTRRLRRYCHPSLLCIDEVGYLSYDPRYADLLFEVVTRRYNEQRSVIITTNKPFSAWPEVFPNAACVVTLVDRLIHRAEIVTLQGKSYRLHEADLRAQRRTTKKTSARREKTEPKRNAAPRRKA